MIRSFLTSPAVSHLSLLVPVFLLCGVAACTHNTAGMEARVSTGQSAQVDAHQLGDDIAITQLQGEYVGGLYRARILLQNLKSGTQTLQYQITWHDSSDTEFPLDETAWTPLIVHGENQVAITAMATNPEAAGYRVTIRDLKANKTFKTNFFGIR